MVREAKTAVSFVSAKVYLIGIVLWMFLLAAENIHEFKSLVNF